MLPHPRRSPLLKLSLAAGAGAMLAFTATSGAALSSETQAGVRVGLEVRNYLAVREDGEAHGSGPVIVIRDPDKALATYVMLDD